MPKYSIVVPFHNEEENVTALYDRLKATMEQIGDSFELVLVDDGSIDRTYKLLEEIAANVDIGLSTKDIEALVKEITAQEVLEAMEHLPKRVSQVWVVNNYPCLSSCA